VLDIFSKCGHNVIVIGFIFIKNGNYMGIFIKAKKKSKKSKSDKQDRPVKDSVEKSGGRPSKLTEELKKEIFQYIEDGLSYADACYLANISEGIFYLWKKVGEKAKEGKFFEFLKGIRIAELKAKRRRLKIIAVKEPGDARLALEMLARKYPKEFGRKEKIEVTGKLGEWLEAIGNVK